MKFYAGVVLYNPNKKNIEWVRSIRDSGLFSDVLIYDNSLISHAGDFIDAGNSYISNLSNDGLSKAYNSMIEKAILEKADFLCLLDQDSDYVPEEIEKMISFLDTCFDKINDSVIIAPRSYTANSKRVSRGDYITEVDFAINSGSFLQLRIIATTGLRYDEEIFLDGVDYEFGMQIKEAGYRTIVYENSVLEQNLGYQIKDDDHFTHHGEKRYYLISHNRKYIFRKHKGVLKGTLEAMLYNFVLCFKIIAFEDEKIKKLFSCIKGMIN